jgi:F0F1-type ATP synthase assembly protein I
VGSKPKPKDKKLTEKANAYLKYSGLAFQMGFIILIGTLAGQQLDERYASERPYFTIFLALLSIFVALYVSLKDLLFSDNDKKDKLP